MQERGKWLAVVLGWCVVLAVLMEMPQMLRIMQAEYNGILTTLNADEEVYRVRVEEALTGHPELAADGYTGDPRIKGTQPAVLESAIGILFAPTGLRAPMVLQILDGILPPMLFLAIVAFLGLSGFSRAQAVLGGIAFSILQLYNLNRPIHQTGSTLVVMAALVGILLALRSSGWMAVAGGVLLGSLFGMTFWPWSFAWTWWGLMTIVCIVAAARSSTAKRSRTILLGAGIVGVLAAAPFLIDMYRASGHPAWEDAVFRSGMYPGRMPESWIYSVLFTIMLGGTLWTVWMEKRSRAFLPATLFLVAIWIVMHQQFVHGQIFNFVSHYLMLMVIAAIMVVLMAWTFHRVPQVIAALAAVIYLCAIGYDGRYVLRQWDAHTNWNTQHLAEAFDALDMIERTRVLSDPETSGLIASFTKHDVAYGLYLKNVLLTHSQIAERFCLTQLPVPPVSRSFIYRTLIYPDALSAFKNPEDRVHEIALVEEACARLDADPAAALQHYGFTHILWDQMVHPEWDLARLNVPLTKVAAGKSWSLYRL